MSDWISMPSFASAIPEVPFDPGVKEVAVFAFAIFVIVVIYAVKYRGERSKVNHIHHQNPDGSIRPQDASGS